MRYGAAQDGRVQHAGQAQIGDELALPGEEPRILDPPDRLADEAVGPGQAFRPG